MAAGALILALLAAAPPAPTPLEGCRALPVRAGWQYRCGTLMATVEDREAAEAAQRLEHVLAELTAAGGARVVETREDQPLGDGKATVRRLENPGQRARAYVATLVRAEGTRLLTCVASAEGSRCDAVLALLAGGAWRAGAAPGTTVEPPAFKLGDRQVRVPDGCRGEATETGAVIDCPPVYYAQWATAPDLEEGRRRAEKFDDTWAQVTGREGVKLVRDTVPCRLAGASTTCHRVRVGPGRADAAVAISAAAQVGEEVLVATCSAPAGVGITVPCALVFGD